MDMHPAERLRTYTDILLSDISIWQGKREALEKIHQLFVNCGSMDVINSQENISNEVWLKNGCAISPRYAGFCLFEITRTRLFVKGLIHAIEIQLAKHPNAIVNVLDAGCGPYALLSMMAAIYFKGLKVRFHILDIHEVNIQQAKKLIQAFEMETMFADYIIADACEWRWKKQEPLHIIVCETMLNALRKEPQVAITLHLAKQLDEDGIFIPESIEVDCVQFDYRKKYAMIHAYQFETDHLLSQYEEAELKLGNIITLTRHSTYDDILKKPLIHLMIPPNHQPDYHSLGYTTTITVFNNYIMHHNDSSLTLPHYFSRPEKNPLPPFTEIDFYYKMEGHPGIYTTIKKPLQ